MIEQHVSAVAGPGAQLLLRPRRALTARQFVGVFVAIASATLAVALYGYSQGNVFAPAFALFDVVFVAIVLRWVWRSGNRFELIALDERRLEVRRSIDGEPEFVAHPYWVRLELADLGERAVHVRLGAQGREVEVGSFLAPQERRELAARLTTLLDAIAGRDRGEQR